MDGLQTVFPLRNEIIPGGCIYDDLFSSRMSKRQLAEKDLVVPRFPQRVRREYRRNKPVKLWVVRHRLIRRVARIAIAHSVAFSESAGSPGMSGAVGLLVREKQLHQFAETKPPVDLQCFERVCCRTVERQSGRDVLGPCPLGIQF